MGRVVFAAFMLLIAGTINLLYGIGALANAKIFVNDTRYLLEDVHALGWVLVILGAIQLTGGISLVRGGAYGRVIGVVAGTLGAIGAVLSIGGRYPWWSLAVFFICLYVVYGILIYGEDERAGGRGSGMPPAAP